MGRLGECRVDLGHQTGIALKPEDVIDAVVLAPGHQLLAGEA